MPRKSVKNKNQSGKIFLVKEFYSDLQRQNMLYAKIVRSPQKNIKITNIDLSILPENYFYFTSRDIPGENYVKTLNTKTNIFSSDLTNYVGEPIGILVGEDIEILEELSVKISNSFIQNKINESIFIPEILAEKTIKTGIFIEKNILTEEAKNESETVKNSEKNIISTWEYIDSSTNFTEPSGAVAFFDGQILTVLAPTKWPFHLKQNLSTVLNIPEENIIIKKTQIQNSNPNGTYKISILAIQTALASLKTGKPVKLILSKEEQKLFIDNKIKIKITHESKVLEDGTISSCKIKIFADVGFQNPYTKELIERLVISSISIYNPQNLLIQAKVQNSQNPPTSINPETLDADGFNAIENHIHQIATECSLLPVEVRKINFQDSKKTLYSPFNYKIQNISSIFEQILSESNFNRKYSAFLLDSKYLLTENNYAFYSLTRRGIGLSFTPYGQGYFGSLEFDLKQSIETTLSLDGTFSIHSHLPSPAVSEIWKKTASKILEIPNENVKIINEFPDDEIPDIPENFYSNLSVMTQLLRKCCNEIQRKRFKNPLPLNSVKSITPAMKKSWNSQNFSGIPFFSTSYASAIIELQINPLTFSISIKEIWVTINCGEIISQKIAENAVRLATEKELNSLVKDSNLFCRKININFVQTNSNPGQIGEIIHNLIPSAFSNALSQVLCTQITKLPISTEEIFNIYKNVKINSEKNEKNEEIQENQPPVSDEIEQSIIKMQEPLKNIIEQIEEQKQENAEKIEEEKEKKEKIQKADEKAVKLVMEKDLTENQENIENSETNLEEK